MGFSKRLLLVVFSLLLVCLFSGSVALAREYQEIIFKDDFRNLSSWNASFELPNRAMVDDSLGFRSNTSLLIDYVEAKGIVNLTKDLGSSYSNVLTRVFFYDDMDNSLGTIVTVSSDNKQPGSNIPFHTGIGVITSISDDYYVVRHNALANTFVTDIKRSRGWHMFEFVITDLGVYCKIDNELVFKEEGKDKFSPLVNKDQKSLKQLGIVSTWGLTGKAWYDEMSVIKPFDGDWKKYPKILSAYHYDIYKDVEFSNLFDRPLSDDNTLRALLDTSAAFYIYGKLENDADAVGRSLELFGKVLNDARWRKSDDWQLGIKMGLLLQNSAFMWEDLDPHARAKVVGLAYDRLYEYLNPSYQFRDPKSGYVYDSKAEENSWHAYFLAQAANYLPDFPEKERIEEKARCFAFHSITTGESRCGLTTQTVYKDFSLENHGFPHPVYAIATIHQLAMGALSYERVGKPIPGEFMHNVVNLYERFIEERLDLGSFHTKNSPKPDWLGAHRSLFVSSVGFEYLRRLGVNLRFNTEDVFRKMSIFYYGVPCVWIVDMQQQQKNPELFRLAMFLNSIYAGGYASAVSTVFANEGYSLFPLKVCEDNIFNEKVWTSGGGINWNCDSNVKKVGNTSIVINSDNPVDAELYSPLIEVTPNKEYSVSYWVKTQNLQPSDSKVYGRIIVAQYKDGVREIDDVSTDKRIDTGFSLGENVSGTTDWIKKSYTFKTTGQTKYIRLRAPLGLQGKAKGKVYFDDIVVKAKDTTSDLNNDGKVDIFDYNILISNFGKTGSPGWIPADINKDGKVDIFDYNILVGEFGSD